MNIDPNGKGWIDWAATKVSVVLVDRGAGADSALRVVRGKGCTHAASPPAPPTQLSGLTSTLPDTVLSHLFSQVRGWGPHGSCAGG